MVIMVASCISYYSYIKPQLTLIGGYLGVCCISYYSYIKPQLILLSILSILVVYRTIPTSNHNGGLGLPLLGSVVYRTIPTSNHNYILHYAFTFSLYIVLFLHQTTTGNFAVALQYELYIVLFLHQTTTYRGYLNLVEQVVYRTIPTSNHNHEAKDTILLTLYIVLFLHQTTTCQQLVIF